MDLICGLVGKFCDLVIDLTWEQLRYLLYYHRNIDQLNEQLKELTLERSSIQHRIEEAENNVEQIEEKVHHWLGQVDVLSEQIQKFHEEESQAKTECNITSCPNPWLRYKLSKRAKAMTEEVGKIFEKRIVGKISYRVPLPSVVELTNREGNEWIDSRVRIMNQILEELRNPSVNMIGLCGLGGVGKTTIAKEVAKNQKIFEKVIMAPVSQEMNIEKIQDWIIEKLDMRLNERTEEGKASRLYVRLKKETKMLLILDDLWKELDLGKVGIPFIDVERDSKTNEGCKILLTSRNETLLSKAMKCQKIIRVDVLLEDEAWELFQSIAELSIESSTSDLKSIASEIVQKSGRLPLAITTAAKALKDKNIDGYRDYLARLKHPLARSFTGIREVDTILKLSYEDLSRENKDIFLLSAMLSHDPSIEDLLMNSVGLDILKHTQNMGDACNAIFDIVGKLKSSNLFLDSFSSNHFTMHDVFRDVALSIASVELNAVIVRHSRLDEWPDENDLKCCKRICLQESDICDLPEELHGPMLEFFSLNSKESDLTIPNMFFRSSKELKVLAITKVNFSSLPSLSFLQKLKALFLHSCLLEDITEIRSLRKLKVLSLAYSEIQQLPVEVAELTSLQMLNLSDCSNLKVIPQKLLSRLKKLEVLHMRNSFNQWKVEDQSGKADENASLDELMDLPISSLEIHIPNLSMMPENLFLKMNLRRYKIFIGERWTWYGDYGASKILKLELESGIDLTARLRNLSKGVEDLHLYGSNGQDNVLYNRDGSGFPCLRHLQIESNNDIKYIVLNSAHHEHAFRILESLELKNLKALENLCEGPNDIVFGQLHTLKMENLPALTGDCSIKDRATKNASNKIFKSLFNKVLLPKLEILKLSKLNSLISLIWDDQLLHNSFNNLKTLRVEKCGFVKLVPLHVLKSLNNLEELDVNDCDMLEIVFDFEDLNDYCKEMESSSVVVPLKMLRLKNLSKLKNVWSNHYQRNVSFPGPRSVDADGCVSLTSMFPASIAKVLPKLEILKLSELNSLIPLIWDDQLLYNSFNNLKTLTVEKCGFLKLVPLHVLKSLNNLEEVQIISCDMLEIVFDFEDFNDCYNEMDSSSLVVPLKKLTLVRLPKLKNVWSNNWQGNVSFPSLRSVDVNDCVSLTSIFPASIAKYMLCNLEELEIYRCGVDVIVAEGQVSESVPVTFRFPNLTSLVLSRLPNLRNFYPQKHKLEWSQLSQLSIKCCDELEIFDKKEVSSSSEIYEEENMLDSKYPLLPHNKVLLPKLEILKLSELNSLNPLIWDNQPLYNSFNNLKTLTVEKCGFVKLVPLHVLKSLNNLEELDVNDCDMLEIVFDFKDLNDYCKEMESSSMVVPLKMLRLKNLSKLKNVWSNHYQRNVSFPGPRSVDADGCVSLTSIFPASIAKVLLPKLEILELSNLNSLISLIWDGQLLHNSFRNLRTLTVEKCGFVKLVPLHVLKSLNNLEEMKVKSCDILEIVFDFEDLNDCYKKMDLSSLVVPLKKLELWNLPKLKNVWSNNWQGNISFPSLRSIKVYNCESLTSIFPASIAKGMLGDLEELQISYCSIDVIVAKDQVSESVGAAFQFSRLTSLQLGHLPQLTNFYPQRHTIERPLFQQLEISEKEVSGSSEIYEEENTPDSKYPLQSHNKVLLPKLEILELSELKSLISLIWDDQLLYNSYNNLKTLTVRQCGFLKLVPLHALKSLNNLEKVEIISCDMLEIVFDFEDLNDYYKEMDSSSVVVPLKKLTLKNLPKLKNVWSNNWQRNVSFPSLRSVYVNDCVSLTSIFPASIAKGMLCNLEELKIYRCGVDVIVAEGQVSEYVPVTFRFPNLTSLVLSGLPNLRNFYPQKHTLEWSQLSQLSIQCCDELEIFEKKEVSSSSKIYEEENMLDSKYPLLPHDEVIRNLERLTLQGKEVEKIGSGQFLMYHFPKLKQLHLSLEKEPYVTYLERPPNLGELKLSGNFEKFVEGNNNVAALHFPKLTLSNISNMRSLSPSLVCPPNLTHLKVDWCYEWTTLMTSSIARSLVHLTHLSVNHCHQIEEIITKQEEEDDGDMEIFFNKMKFLEFVHLSRLRRFCFHNYTFRFPLLEHVTIEGCPRLTMFSPGAIHAPQLQSVEVNESSSHTNIWMIDLNNTIQHLFTFKGVLSTTESMAINAENITRIVDVFPNVSRLYVESFTDEGVTFPYSSLEKFPKLIWLDVEHCSFEEIFPSQDQIIDFMGKIPPFEHLDIAYMDKLKSIWKDDSQLPPIHQNLSYLFIKSCCSLVKLAPSSASFQNLHVLNVSKCHQLINLVTTSTAKSLVGLKHLEINDCKSMEEIVMNDTDEDVQAGITFNQLHKIKLTDMPSLKMFSPQSHTFEFPELKEIEISRCPGMKKFCPGVLKTPKLSKVKIEEHHMKWKDEGDFNKTMEGLSSAKDSINI